MHVTPVPLWLEQSPPAATTPAPGPHTSRSGMLQASADPDYSGAFTVTGRAGFGSEPLDRSFRPRGDLQHRMSLSTLVLFSPT